ncbi:MAG: GDYXXLXY domain-containing protein [Saprospiraceae bacterium]
MISKNIQYSLFGLICLVQWWVPFNMINYNENILANGKAYKFLSAPVDPTDPFLGKYIDLNFEEMSAEVDSSVDWKYGQKVFVILGKDSLGFAKIISISAIEPNEKLDFVDATINYVSRESVIKVSVNYPFDRFYMEEFKAPEADRVYAEVSADSLETAYALVMVKEGKAVIKDVMIGETSLKDIVKKRMSKNE